MLAADAAAAVAAPQVAPRDQAIVVSPVLFQREVDPGGRLVLPVTVRNQTRRTFSFTTAVQDLAPGRSPGEDKRFAAAGSTARGAGAMLSPSPRSFRLPAGAERIVQVRVDVPAGAEPGGRYGALLVQALPRRGGGGIALRADVSVLFLLKVAGGNVRPSLRVRAAPRDSWWLRPDGRWDVELRNSGNVHATFAGQLRLDPLLGATRSVTLRPAIVLPGATRRFTVETAVRDVPNVLSARVRYEVEERGDSRYSRSSGIVVVTPWWLLAGSAAVLVLLVLRRLLRRGGTTHSSAED